MVENNDMGATSGGFGQRFIACGTGLIEQISLKTGNNFNSPTVALQLKDPNCTVVWTVANLAVGPNQIVTIDLADGSGASRNVINGQLYTFVLLFSGGSGNQLIRASDANPYPGGAAVGSGNCGTFANFDLWFRVSIGQNLPPLPIELTDFHANIFEKTKGVDLSFSTASQSTASHFTIQNSTDGTDFYDIGTVPSHGTTTEPHSYEFTHESPAPGDNYYRLKMVDLDGSFEFSKVVQIYIGGEQGFRIVPNPVGDEVRVVFDEPMDHMAALRILRADGQIAHKEAIPAEAGEWTVQSMGLVPGIYWLELVDGQGKVFHQKFTRL